jgi:hypothetical protein
MSPAVPGLDQGCSEPASALQLYATGGTPQPCKNGKESSFTR